MDKITAADLIVLVETMESCGKISHDDRKILLGDMVTILDEINENPSQMSLTKSANIMTLRTINYSRVYAAIGALDQIRFSNRGIMYRADDKPAVSTYYVSGKIRTKQWCVDGSFYRQGDKPAYVSYYENGLIETEMWAQGDGKHRDGDKPAEIRYYDNGIMKLQEWVRRGSLHRDGGTQPVAIYYDNRGYISEQVYQDQHNKLLHAKFN